MCDQTEVTYDENDVVWVKLGPVWWPGVVVAPEKEDGDNGEQTVKPTSSSTIAIVKFFDEDTYEYVKQLDRIYHYNCRRKDEFIKKGLDKSRTGASHMAKFPDDVIKAEEMVGGDKDIINDSKFAPAEKVIDSSFATPLKSAGRSDSSFFSPSRRNENGTLNSSRHSFASPLKNNKNYESKILTKGTSEPTQTGPNIKCSFCSFTRTRIETIISHVVYAHSRMRRDFAPDDYDYVPRSRSTHRPLADTAKTRKRKAKPRKVPVAAVVAEPTPSKTPVKRPSTTAEKAIADKKKRYTDALLADWSEDEDDARSAEPEEKETPMDESVAEKEEEKPTEKDQAPEEPEPESIPAPARRPVLAPFEEKKESTSCFDFEDDEDGFLGMSDAHTYGRKIPRVIPIKDKTDLGMDLEIDELFKRKPDSELGDDEERKKPPKKQRRSKKSLVEQAQIENGKDEKKMAAAATPETLAATRSRRPGARKSYVNEVIATVVERKGRKSVQVIETKVERTTKKVVDVNDDIPTKVERTTKKTVDEAIPTKAERTTKKIVDVIDEIPTKVDRTTKKIVDEVNEVSSTVVEGTSEKTEDNEAMSKVVELTSKKTLDVNEVTLPEQTNKKVVEEVNEVSSTVVERPIKKIIEVPKEDEPESKPSRRKQDLKKQRLSEFMDLDIISKPPKKKPIPPPSPSPPPPEPEVSEDFAAKFETLLAETVAPELPTELPPVREERIELDKPDTEIGEEEEGIVEYLEEEKVPEPVETSPVKKWKEHIRSKLEAETRALSPQWNQEAKTPSPKWNLDTKSQSPKWTQEAKSQSPKWTQEAKSQSPKWTQEAKAQSPKWTPETKAQSPKWNIETKPESPKWNQDVRELSPKWPHESNSEASQWNQDVLSVPEINPPKDIIVGKPMEPVKTQKIIRLGNIRGAQGARPQQQCIVLTPDMVSRPNLLSPSKKQVMLVTNARGTHKVSTGAIGMRQAVKVVTTRSPSGSGQPIVISDGTVKRLAISQNKFIKIGNNTPQKLVLKKNWNDNKQTLIINSPSTSSGAKPGGYVLAKPGRTLFKQQVAGSAPKTKPCFYKRVAGPDGKVTLQPITTVSRKVGVVQQQRQVVTRPVYQKAKIPEIETRQLEEPVVAQAEPTEYAAEPAPVESQVVSNVMTVQYPDGSQAYMLVTMDENGVMRTVDGAPMVAPPNHNVMLVNAAEEIPRIAPVNPPQDILAEALANTNVLESEPPMTSLILPPDSAHNSILTSLVVSPTALQDTPTIIMAPVVQETSVTLQKPIMTPVEVPTAVVPDASDLQPPPLPPTPTAEDVMMDEPEGGLMIEEEPPLVEESTVPVAEEVEETQEPGDFFIDDSQQGDDERTEFQSMPLLNDESTASDEPIENQNFEEQAARLNASYPAVIVQPETQTTQAVIVQSVEPQAVIVQSVEPQAVIVQSVEPQPEVIQPLIPEPEVVTEVEFVQPVVPQPEVVHTVVQQAEVVHSVVPQADDIHSIVPQADDIHSIVPQADDIHSIIPQADDVHSIVPQAEDIHSVVPEAEVVHSIVPQADDIHSVVPQNEVEDFVTSETEVVHSVVPEAEVVHHVVTSAEEEEENYVIDETKENTQERCLPPCEEESRTLCEDEVTSSTAEDRPHSEEAI